MSFITGTLKIEIIFPDSHSLKDKRRVLKSLMDRLQNKFNISIAEVEHLDSRHQTVIAIALVSNNQQFVFQQLQTIMEFVRNEPNIIPIKFEKELL